ncbi:DNA repair protein XRCC2 [Armadillidium vulgare]|nr:DNA repair protein XRCC2 [Armadillidium vulgare]
MDNEAMTIFQLSTMAMQTESGLSFLSRVGAKSVSDLAKNLFTYPLNPPEFIEISGDAGVGKSLLCMDLMATALLPKTIFNVFLGGLETGVIFIDCDQHFSILHFTDLLERKIKKKCLQKRKELKQRGESQSENDILSISKKDFNLKIQNTIKNCLKNLFYFNCSNSNQFTVTLLSLGQSLTY